MIATDLDLRQESPLRLFRSSSSNIRVASMDFNGYSNSDAHHVIPLTYSRSFVGANDNTNSQNSPSSSTSGQGSRLYKKGGNPLTSSTKKRLYKRFAKSSHHSPIEDATSDEAALVGHAGIDSGRHSDVVGNSEPRTPVEDLSAAQCAPGAACDSCYNSFSSPIIDSGPSDGDVGKESTRLAYKSLSESNLLASPSWQPPCSDPDNDIDDVETLRSMAERNRTAAAKLFPKIQQRRQRDSGIVLHERTSSKDSEASSPNLVTYFMNSVSTHGSESSSIATDFSSISFPEGYFADMPSRMDMSRPEDRSIGEEPFCSVSFIEQRTDGDHLELEENYAVPNQVAEKLENQMSSSNLVYAVPVKPIYDPLLPIREITEDSTSRPQMSDCRNDATVSHLNLAEGTHTGNHEPGRFSSPQNQPKRTVVPVYPLQSFSPSVEPRLKRVVKDSLATEWIDSLAQLKLSDQENYTNDVCVLKIAETDVNLVTCNINKSDTLEDCLSKPLDVVLTNVTNKIMLGMHAMDDVNSSGEAEVDNESNFCTEVTLKNVDDVCAESRDSLQKEKSDLIFRLTRKLKILKEEKEEVEEEMRANDTIGSQLIAFISGSHASPALKEKVRLYIDDVERITKLFLKLCSQVKRLTANSSSEDFIDRRKRKSTLQTQLEDAKELKNGIYRRGIQLARLLPDILTADQMVDYQYFIRMKSKLLVEAHEIDEKMQHGEAQREVLKQN